MPGPSRQLAAIMFTDIVGYTALMGKDSAKALELVRKSKEIQQPLVEEHNGKWLKEMGDGAMAQFSTALDAINCAVEIQRVSRADFDGDLRIGIHSGDITIENDDVYGDGVNVASRLESTADPGGIYISESIEKAIQGQTDIQAKYLGEVKLKNVAYGVRTYAVQGVGLPVPEIKEDQHLKGHLWAEVQRRGLVRAAIAYLVVGLLLILLMREAQNWLTLPGWSLTGLVTAMIIGFPLAMYLAWNYERGPEGFVRTTSQQSWQNPLPASQRKPFTGTFIIAGLIGIIVIMYLYPRFLSGDQGNKGTDAYLEPTVLDKSIAVLPFVDMSPNKDQEYLGDGISEEILNVLSKIEELKVIGRTSSFSYKGKDTDLMTIGKELGVGTILEGSVRMDGNQIRITAQFINATDGSHIWSESYDRELKDVFKIQDDLAQSISGSLLSSINISKSGVPSEERLLNDEAYNLYLLGKHYHNKSKGDRDDNLYEAIELLNQSLELDSSFANTYVALANTYSSLGFFHGERENEDVWVLAEKYSIKALELDGANSEALSNMAYIKRNNWDWEGAQEHYRRSLSVAPSNSESLRGYAHFLSAINQHDSAMSYARKALELNPTSDKFRTGLMRTAYYGRKYDLAITQSEMLEQFTGESKFFLLEILIQSDKDKAVSMILDSTEMDNASKEKFATLYRKQGWKPMMESIYLEYKDRLDILGTGGIDVFLYGAPKDLIFQSLAVDVRNKVGWRAYILVDPRYDPIRSDPRFDELLATMGLDKYK